MSQVQGHPQLHIKFEDSFSQKVKIFTKKEDQSCVPNLITCIFFFCLGSPGWLFLQSFALLLIHWLCADIPISSAHLYIWTWIISPTIKNSFPYLSWTPHSPLLKGIFKWVGGPGLGKRGRNRLTASKQQTACVLFSVFLMVGVVTSCLKLLMLWRPPYNGLWPRILRQINPLFPHVVLCKSFSFFNHIIEMNLE